MLNDYDRDDPRRRLTADEQAPGGMALTRPALRPANDPGNTPLNPKRAREPGAALAAPRVGTQLAEVAKAKVNADVATANSALRAGTALVNAGSSPTRDVVNTGRDFVAGLQGEPAPDPITGFTAPQLAPVFQRPALAGATAAPVAGPAGGAGGAPAAPTAPRPNNVEVAGPAAGELNTYTNSAGQTRAIAADPNAAATNAAEAAKPVIERAPGLQVDPQAIAASTAQQQRGFTRQTRADAGELLNPNSDGGEIMRRMSHAAQGYKGSPSARAAVIAALAGQLGAQNQASATGQGAQNATVAQGAQGAVEGGLQQQQAEAGLVRDRGLQAGLERLEGLRADRQENAASAPIITRNGYARVRGNTAEPIVGADGQPIQPPAGNEPGAITPAMRYEALAEQRAGLLEAPMDAKQKQALLAQVDAELAALVDPNGGGGAPAAQIPAQAVADLRKNPALAAQFEAKYRLPPGSAASYLNP